MRDWYFGGNALKQYKLGSIIVIEMPLWLWLLDWWADHGCNFIPPIPLPNWPKIHWDKDDPDYIATPKEWFGDLRQLYCGLVAMKLTQWVWMHPKRKSYSVEIGWDKLKEIMYENDKEYFDEHEKTCIEIEKEEEEEKKK